MEKIDIPSTYSEIKQAIDLEDHEKVLHLSDKILKSSNSEKEALNCKIIALINLNKIDDSIIILKNNNLYKEYVLEYAYCLHEKKDYEGSLKVLQDSKNKSETFNELVAQNYYKLNKFTDSYNIYKEILEGKLKSSDPAINDDLITNFLASYINAASKDDLKWITKYMNSWESFYNNCIICLNNGNFKDLLEAIKRMNSFGKQDDEYNEYKAKYLIFSVFQHYFEHFDLTKISNLVSEYEKLLSNNKFNDLNPYFFNAFLNIKKEKENTHEVVKKYDAFLKTENLLEADKNDLIINKIIILLKGNKINEATEILKKLPKTNDSRRLIIDLYVLSKTEKPEKFEEILIKGDSSKPEYSLVYIQNLLSNLNSKTFDNFHSKLLAFVDTHFSFCSNIDFLQFFIGFYQSRHLKQRLSELVSKFEKFEKSVQRKNEILLLASTFAYLGNYSKAAEFFEYYLEKIDSFDKEVKVNLVNALAHVDMKKSEQLRKTIDNTMVDLSSDNIAGLLNEVFLKFKRNNANLNAKKDKKKKKRKIIYPKGFDPKHPGPLPDPERWLPKLQRKKYKNLLKNKKAHQGSLPTDQPKK